MDKRNITALIFLDLSTAFDIVDHDTLLEALKSGSVCLFPLSFVLILNRPSYEVSQFCVHWLEFWCSTELFIGTAPVVIIYHSTQFATS